MSAAESPPATLEMPKLAYSMDEAASAAALSKSALYEDIAAGLLEIRKRGARTLILVDELRRNLAALPVAEKGEMLDRSTN